MNRTSPTKRFGFANAEGTDTTANQAYNEAVTSGSFTGSFADYVNKYGNKGYLNSAIDTLNKFKNLFGAAQTDTTPLPSTPPASSSMPPAVAETYIMGLKPGVFIAVALTATGLIGFGIYKLVTKGK